MNLLLNSPAPVPWNGLLMLTHNGAHRLVPRPKSYTVRVGFPIPTRLRLRAHVDAS